jgi:FHA domain
LPSVFEIPAELIVLGLRIAIIIALYGFLFIVIREIRKDWKRTTVTRSSSFGLVVSSSQSDKVEVGRVFELDDRNSIGRLQNSAIRLDDEHISARHAEVFVGANGTWLLRDAGSTNGTRLNGEPVSGQVHIKSGDLIDLGTVTFRFEHIGR